MAAELEALGYSALWIPDVGGDQEQFGLAFESDNPLVGCANIAIEAMREDGRLDDLKNEWLEVDTSERAR